MNEDTENSRITSLMLPTDTIVGRKTRYLQKLFTIHILIRMI